jgi:hypothetical protein
MGNTVKSWEKIVQQIWKNIETYGNQMKSDIGKRYPSIFAML